MYCGDCGSRLMVTHAKNGKGIVYPYFICAGLHSKRTDCTLRSIQIEHAEDLIQDLYDRISLTPDFRRDLETLLRHGLKQPRADTDAEREQFETAKLAANERSY